VAGNRTALSEKWRSPGLIGFRHRVLSGILSSMVTFQDFQTRNMLLNADALNKSLTFSQYKTRCCLIFQIRYYMQKCRKTKYLREKNYGQRAKCKQDM
jgi:hypothetical protein